MKPIVSFITLSLSLLSLDAVADVPTEAAAVVAAAAHPTAWMMSARGVAEDQTTLGVGIVFVAPYPTLDLRLQHGLTPRIALDAHLATLGFTQAARVGARFRVLERSAASIAIRGSVLEGHTTLDDGRVWIAAGPGALASFGSDAVQVTTSLDLGVMFHDSAAAIAGNGPGVALRPAIGIELPLDAGMSLMIETGGVVLMSAYALDALPFFATGIAW